MTADTSHVWPDAFEDLGPRFEAIQQMIFAKDQKILALELERGHMIQKIADLERDLRFWQTQIEAGNILISMLMKSQPEIRTTAHFRPFLLPPDEGGSIRR